MGIADVATRTIAVGKQSALGTLALTSAGRLYNHRPATAGGLNKEAFNSESVNTSRMRANPRHGLRSGLFTLDQELQIGGHNELFAAALNAAWATQPTTGALTNITATVAAPQFVRAAGSFITDGFKVGDVVRWTGWTAPATANNARNFWITALTATQMSGIFLDGTAVAAKTAGDSVTCTEPGRRLQIPTASHTKDYFTIDDWHADGPSNLRIRDAVVSSVAFDIGPNGIATVAINFVGTDGTPGTAQYFSAPTAAPTGAFLAGPNGKINWNGNVSAVMMGLQLTLDNSAEVKPVIGANVSPDVFRADNVVTGSMSALFDGNALITPFDTEAEAPLYLVLTADSTAASEFLVIKLPNVKLNSMSKAADGPAYSVSADFSAGRYVGANAAIEGTSLVLIDSTAT
jgi:hypothetical protein